MQVLAVTSELHPLIKTGGLADVAGALPGALAKHGIKTRSLLPAYPRAKKAAGRTRALHSYADLFGGPARLLSAKLHGLDLLLLDAPHLFDRDGGPYGDVSGRDWEDNWRRFAALGAVAADIAGGAIKGYKPDLVHAHDWQAALAPAYMRHGAAAVTPSLITIHNLAFQGRFDAAIFSALGLPPSAWSLDGVEYYGGVGYLKAGLQYADAITTVSPTYADEIRTTELGMGLDGLLRRRGPSVSGIVNGIDIDEWDPASDALIAGHFSARAIGTRRRNRRAIERRFGLKPGTGPIFCVISRLTWQKGMDLLAECVDRLVGDGGRLVVLGSGDGGLERAFLSASARHPGAVGVQIGYDEPLAHQMQAGCDAILIPSRFEPCGLTQLYGLRYGCVPIAARTGGLADTIIDTNEAALAAGVGTGFLFAPHSRDPLAQAISRVTSLFHDSAIWANIQRQGMKADFSWERSAARYAALYRELIDKKVEA